MQNVLEKLLPDPYLKSKIEHIFGPLAFIKYTAFLKNKKRSGTSFPASFSA